jgi:16S rRNA (uracil1498-N3)-methyltransferase
MKIATRLHCDQQLRAGGAIGLEHDRSHYLRTVLRLKPGAMVALFNARDGEWLAEIDGLGKGWCSLTVKERRRKGGPETDLWLVFAPVKRARLDFLAEKATELGCSVLQPVFTRYTAVDRVNIDRLRANAREAAEQCERLSLPEVREPAVFGRLLADWPSERCLIACLEAGSAPPIRQILESMRGGAATAVLVGPEGGFAPDERRLLEISPSVVAAGLGPRVLRSDTAALAALACIQAWTGDWSRRPPGRGDEDQGDE